jgi:hypothetical protein
LTFTDPIGFIEVPVVKNGQMHYEYALKDTARNFEIRYAVSPLDSVFMQFNAMKSQGTIMAVGPNKLYYTAFVSTMVNISNSKMGKMNTFPADAVKQEFNADWGSAIFCEPAGFWQRIQILFGYSNPQG